MKKGNKTYTAEELREQAEELTDRNRFDAEYECENAWRKLANSYLGESNNYVFERIFTDAAKYFKARQQDISKGLHQTFRFMIYDEVVKILSFNFSYEYEMCTWDEQTLDPDDPAVFEYETQSDSLNCSMFRRGVVENLRDFLLAGAIQAKRVCSDAYPLWRQALMEFDYTYRYFEDGAEKEKVEAFLDAVENAARMTAIDSEVFKQLNLSQKSLPKGKKARK